MDQEKIEKLDELRKRLSAYDKHLNNLDSVRQDDPHLHLKIGYNKDSGGRYSYLELADEGFAITPNLMVHCYKETIKALREKVQLEIDSL